LRTGVLAREKAENPPPAIAITAMQSKATTKVPRDFMGKLSPNQSGLVTKRG
jgi:hypothetical protein